MHKIFTVLLSILISFSIINGCDSGSKDQGADFETILNETFDSYNASNYTIYGGGTWTVIDDSGNMALQHESANGYMIYNNYPDTSTDYTVTARVKPSATTGVLIGVITRFNDSGTHDMYFITIESGTPSSLSLRKCKGGSCNVPDDDCTVDFVNALSTTTWYTITMEIKGTQIDGNVTDGTNTATLSWNDDGTIDGTAITSGKGGLVDMSATMNSLLDDLKITEP